MQTIKNIANMNVINMMGSRNGNWGGNNIENGFGDEMIVS